tara:strand:- start:205 stop:1539 length:1335 start_codon:yes stop_codon:yes gene_type:complete
MKIYFLVLKNLTFGLLIYNLNFKKKLKLFLVTYQLINKFSYRIPKINNYDRLIFLREIRYIILSLFTIKKSDFIYNKNGDSIILEGGTSLVDKEKHYVNYHHKDTVLHSYVSKDNIMSKNLSTLFDKFAIIFILFLFSPYLIIFTFFSSKRAKISLLVREIIEVVLLIKYLIKFKIIVVYDFIPYEKDSNFLAYCLVLFKIKIYKIPSLGPLNTHNNIIVSDKLIISSEYHNEETKVLKKFLFVQDFEKWLPENCLDYLPHYVKNLSFNNHCKIGYYSHACWLRNRDGNSYSSLFSFDDEIELLEILNEYCKLKDSEIVVFPHPKELLEKNKVSAKDFYSQYLGSNFKFFDSGTTALNFEKVDIAVSTYSTVTFERLFMGFKSLFYTKSINEFPLPSASLNNICASSKEIFLEKLDVFLNYSRKEYFESNNLNSYVYKDLLRKL